MSSNKYKEILNIIKNRFEGEILYIPHRLEHSSNYLGYPFKILEPGVCFEIFLIQLSFLPKNILGFYSTALITSKNILSEYRGINFINFDTNFLTPEIKVLFDEIFLLTDIKTESFQFLK